jgi:hypothetical protein
MVIVMIMVLVWGILAITSGIGVLSRRQWARILALVVSGISAAAGLSVLIDAFGVLNAGPGIGQARGSGLMGFLLINFFLAAILIGYCVWCYLVLLNARNSSEFR